MAKFHALPIAMRLLSPNIFDEKIRSYLQRINLYEGVDKNGEICQVNIHVMFVCGGRGVFFFQTHLNISHGNRVSAIVSAK